MTIKSTESLNLGNSPGGTSLTSSHKKSADLDKQLLQMKRDMKEKNALENIRLEQSQAQMDIMAIIRKYGGASADASWANELTAIDQKQKPSYLESRSETESVASSIQEETYQMIKKKYAMMGVSSS